MESVAMRIGGRDAGSADGRYFEKRNPFTGELVSRVPDAGPLDAVAAAEAAAAAFAAWSGTPPSRRRAILWKAADLLEQRAPDIAKTITAETAATLGWGMFNTAFAATMMREAAAATTQITGEMIPSDIPGNIALSVRQPVGVVLGIAPWNAPMILGVRAVAMPLACGNTVVLKASEECPQTHRIIGDVLEDAGLPAGAINVLTTSREGAGATVDALIADPRIRRINFTGSTEVGRTIAQKARDAPQTRSARARRQGAAGGAGRRRHRRSGGGRNVRRVHASGPDLHVHRAPRRPGKDCRALRRKARDQSEEPPRRRSDSGQHSNRVDGERALREPRAAT